MPGTEYLLAISIDRSTLSPCIIVAPQTMIDNTYPGIRRFPFEYHMLPGSCVNSVVEYLQCGSASLPSLSKIVNGLTDIFFEKEAFLLETRLFRNQEGELAVINARFGFDDAAYRSSKRQEDMQGLRDKKNDVTEEVDAERDGIVYIK